MVGTVSVCRVKAAPDASVRCAPGGSGGEGGGGGFAGRGGGGGLGGGGDGGGMGEQPVPAYMLLTALGLSASGRIWMLRSAPCSDGFPNSDLPKYRLVRLWAEYVKVALPTNAPFV